MNTTKDLVLTLYQNLENILINSSEAHVELQSKIFSNKLHDFVENDNVSISTSPAVLAADFLQVAGKSTLLHQVIKQLNATIFLSFLSKDNN
ncbi:unnamed protein product [Rotaria sp. Silwood2]|nr:unnamed protein product [Rotaria sp. Silwood2]CAF4619805.1 unnamed protein product [Rotaria sp. Silwood2]